MKETREINSQASAILEGLQTLTELLELPVAREALDVNKNATSSKHYEVLRRLRQSLQQYLGRNGDLFYVGLLGHFSSGKSSTINSLLESWNTKNERQVDLHPTDTTITLITQDKNTSSLLGIIKEGHVTIRFQAVESPLLDSLVLVDTPGTGDPALLTEMARDFLPICDVIFFLFSAASPLDQTDIPILAELHRRLSFIPLRFVITRADELRKDHTKPVSDANLDTNKVSKFLAEAVTRVNTLLKPSVYTAEHFTLVDNKSNYHIGTLREFLRSKCNVADHDARVTMSLNKLHFFLLAAKELRTFFGGFLETKLAELTKIVTAADKNIQKYNEIVIISTSHLTRAWADHLTTINNARYQSIQRLKAAPDLPNEMLAFPRVANKKNQAYAEMGREAQYVAGRIAARVRLEIRREFRKRLNEIENAILATEIDEIGPGKHDLTTISISFNLAEIEAVPAELLAKRSAEVRSTESDMLQESAADLRSLLDELERLLEIRTPLPQAEAVVHSAQEALGKELNQFFQNVELYRNGVFSHTTKESIATLGIGGKLDALEMEFTDDDKATFRAATMSELFPGFPAMSADAITKLGQVSERVRALGEEIRPLRMERPPSIEHTIAVAAAEHASGLQHDIQREVQADADALSEKLAISIDALLANIQSAFGKEMQAAVKARRTRYGLIIGTTAIVAGLGYFAFHHFRAPAPGSIFGTVGWGVASNVIADCLALLWARLRDNFPKAAKQIREQYVSQLRKELKDVIEGALDGHKFSALNDTSLTNRLTVAYHRILGIGIEEFASRTSEFLQALKAGYGSYTSLRNRYIENIVEIAQQCSTFFSDSTRNLTILNAVAARIKARAIEPSFRLLDQTRQELENVKRDIERVDFTWSNS